MFDELYDFSILNDDEMDLLPLMSFEEDDFVIEGELENPVPILPLRHTVLFPSSAIPITVGREKSIKAVRKAFANNKMIAVFAQIEPQVEEPKKKNLHKVGTLAQIIKMLKMPDGTNTVILQGKQRCQMLSLQTEEPFISANVELLRDTIYDDKEFQALISSIKDLAGQIIKLSPNIPNEANIFLRNIVKPSFLIHFISTNLNVSVKDKQRILEIGDLKAKAKLILSFMNTEFQLLELKDQIQNKVKTDIEKQQRDYFLHQQLKTIQEELGDESYEQEIDTFKTRAKDKKWPVEVKKRFEKELNKLKRMNPAVAEYSVLMNYIELLLDLPWHIYSEDSFDLVKSAKVLDKDHYGLEKVKKRILEYLAVLKLKGDLKSPILCFVGPPGVGKTSLGKSIARSLDRKFIRMSLGGLQDESEIRGHRKTYIGSMPGRIIQSIKKAQTSNPVFILDEIDKVGNNFRGDPSSALLEVLDPEQNSAFHDNYLEVEYDLSKVLFIATANSLSTIQPALRDRMEIIHISGYSLEEKIKIAQKHLIPRQRLNHGLKAADIKLDKKAIAKIINDYTKESGVRDLERQLASVMRRIAKSVAMEEEYDKAVKEESIKDILGVRKYDKEIYQVQNPPGVAVGLAWTIVGGDILFIEALTSKGKGKLTLTGNLGDVMKESATTALSYIQSNAADLGIDPEVFEKTNIHIHVPEGAIPKDGPSAGVTMLTALCSTLSQRKVKPFLAMTGEITLRGKVLPVGGIKEKILAAKRAGIKEVILCEANRKDVGEINPVHIKGLKIHYVQEMKEVLALALMK